MCLEPAAALGSTGETKGQEQDGAEQTHPPRNCMLLFLKAMQHKQTPTTNVFTVYIHIHVYIQWYFGV